MVLLEVHKIRKNRNNRCLIRKTVIFSKFQFQAAILEFDRKWMQNNYLVPDCPKYPKIVESDTKNTLFWELPVSFRHLRNWSEATKWYLSKLSETVEITRVRRETCRIATTSCLGSPYWKSTRSHWTTITSSHTVRINRKTSSPTRKHDISSTSGLHPPSWKLVWRD